ncbi:glycosyltransferase 87 family protein [Paraburkholderia bryophila]|uniref:4-amino-4-deoxy-L-arabinose transferase-like glycosyltransferase n=1 Tax=Paraburkholderia bryophila TaxID=420952 RepID=A0A7Y9WL25_9BURK|nr:glycosyltransferase 87 family protein [Paraburkholderia bryophila]NYH22303.1 hypothetical protein [Paraburkholderia bryophila]
MKSNVQHADTPANRGLRRIDLNSRRAMKLACIFVPLLFGLYSLWLGADSNWDLYNYHLYNPFAWLHGKLLIDLAPAGMQSYFNPLMDVVLYTLNSHLPSRVVGFFMGVLHGLTFVLLVAIARQIWPALSNDNRYRVPILIAVAGCLTANFLSGLGNSMGDDTTALLNLGGLLTVLANWQRLAEVSFSATLVAIGSGLLVGLGAGLKLTNAVYAVALCLSLLSYPGNLVVRLRISFLFGVGVLIGIAITGGYWMFHMWELFGNPMYPQFGAIFHNPLTQQAAAADVRWLPRGLLETLLWPFIITADSHRVGETPIRQIIWPMVEVALCCVCVVFAGRWLKGNRERMFDPRQRLVVLFVALGFVLWMKLFSIYRYIVAIEVLAPMVFLLLLQCLLPERRAQRSGAILLAIASAVVVTGGGHTWGHEGWSDPLYHAQLPPLPQPERTTVVIYSDDAAWGWVATRFPDTVAFTQIESSFPATDAFRNRIPALARERGGPTFGMINGTYNWRQESVERVNRIALALGVNKTKRGCDAMRWVLSRLRFHAAVTTEHEPGEQCSLGIRDDDRRDITAENRDMAARTVPIFERNGFNLDVASCVPYRSGIGKGVQVYQWCRLSLR